MRVRMFLAFLFVLSSTPAVAESRRYCNIGASPVNAFQLSIPTDEEIARLKSDERVTMGDSKGKAHTCWVHAGELVTRKKDTHVVTSFLRCTNPVLVKNWKPETLPLQLGTTETLASQKQEAAAQIAAPPQSSVVTYKVEVTHHFPEPLTVNENVNLSGKVVLGSDGSFHLVGGDERAAAAEEPKKRCWFLPWSCGSVAKGAAIVVVVGGAAFGGARLAGGKHTTIINQALAPTQGAPSPQPTNGSAVPGGPASPPGNGP